MDTALLQARWDLLHRTIESPCSDFYRRRFSYFKDVVQKGPSEEGWAQIPLLSREELAQVPYPQRLFVEPTEARAIRATGGTTGASVLLIPRTDSPSITQITRDCGVTPRGYLTFMNPHYIVEEALENDGLHLPVLAGDMTDLATTLRMLAQIPQINAIRALTHPPEQVWPLFKEAGINERIEIMEMLGPYWNAWMVQRLQMIFPNAAIIIAYGMVEVQWHVGVCAIPPGEAVTEVLYTSFPGYYYEILNDSGEITTLHDGDEGELVLTTLDIPSTKGLPLIRYRTGDRIRVKQMRGENAFSFYALGRSAHDRLKLVFGILWSHEIERALSKVLGTAFTGEYELEVKSASASNPKERAIVRVSRSASQDNFDPDIADAIAREIRVAPEKSYADAAGKGLLGALCIEPLPDIAGSDMYRKRKRMYRTD